MLRKLLALLKSHTERTSDYILSRITLLIKFVSALSHSGHCCGLFFALLLFTFGHFILDRILVV